MRNRKNMFAFLLLKEVPTMAHLSWWWRWWWWRRWWGWWMVVVVLVLLPFSGVVTVVVVINIVFFNVDNILLLTIFLKLSQSFSLQCRSFAALSIPLPLFFVRYKCTSNVFNKRMMMNIYNNLYCTQIHWIWTCFSFAVCVQIHLSHFHLMANTHKYTPRWLPNHGETQEASVRLVGIRTSFLFGTVRPILSPSL